MTGLETYIVEKEDAWVVGADGNSRLRSRGDELDLLPQQAKFLIANGTLSKKAQPAKVRKARSSDKAPAASDTSA